jgi:hypothetical protein
MIKSGIVRMGQHRALEKRKNNCMLHFYCETSRTEVPMSLGDPGVYERIILKNILDKYGVKM